MLNKILDYLRNKVEKESIPDYLSRGGALTITFGDEGHRMEVKKNDQGVSELTLFSDETCIFKGRYGELVEKIHKSNTNPYFDIHSIKAGDTVVLTDGRKFEVESTLLCYDPNTFIPTRGIMVYYDDTVRKISNDDIVEVIHKG